MVKGWFGRLGPHYGPRLDLTIMIEHQTGCKNFVCNIYHNHSSIVPDLDLGGYSSSSYSLYSSATLLSFAGNITGVMVFHTAYQLKAGTVHNLWFNVSTYGVAEEWSNPNATLLHAWASTAVDDGSSGQGFSINWIRVS